MVEAKGTIRPNAAAKSGGEDPNCQFSCVLSACASVTQHFKNTSMLMNMNLVDNVFDCGEL